MAGPDQVYGDEARFGLGDALGCPWDQHASGVFGLADAGGSWAGADRRR